jgi:hypothetical protein
LDLISLLAAGAFSGFLAGRGTLGFIVRGSQEPGRPPDNLGYVNLPAFGGIVVVSVLFTPLGAWLAYRLPDKLHRRLFALFVIVVVTRMLIGRL